MNLFIFSSLTLILINVMIKQKNILIQRINKLSDSLWLPKSNEITTLNDTPLFFTSKIHNLNKFDNLNESWFKNEFYLSHSIKSTFEPINESNISTTQIVKSLKINLKPNKNQCKSINEWFDVYRYFYNRTIDFIENKKVYDYRIVKRDIKKIDFKFNNETKKYILKDKELNNFIIPDWVVNKNIPKRIISGAIIDCCKAYKTCLSSLKNKSITKFKMKYKTKKDNINCLSITKDCFSVNNELFVSVLGKGNNKLKGWYYTTLHKWNMLNKIPYVGNPKQRIKVQLQDIPIKQDCRLNYINNKYILYVPITVETNKCINKGTISLDSGIKTFQTGFSDKNYCIKIGDAIFDEEAINKKVKINKVNKLKKRSDRLSSLISTCENKENKIILNEKLKRTNLTLRNKIDDMHWKSINYVTTTHSNIILCDFQSKSIASKAYKSTNRNLNILSHYKFKLRLEYKCKANGCSLNIVNESYTSKLCTNCGCCKDDLKCNRVYNCNFCGIVIDRDMNGARNILINYLGNK